MSLLTLKVTDITLYKTALPKQQEIGLSLYITYNKNGLKLPKPYPSDT